MLPARIQYNTKRLNALEKAEIVFFPLFVVPDQQC